MNKIYMVKRNALGQSVVCSEKTKSRGKVKALVLALTVVGSVMSTAEAVASIVYQTTTPEVKFDAKDTILIGKNLTVETESAYDSSNIVIGNDSKVYDLSKSISLGNNNVLGDATTLGNGSQPTNAIAVGNDNIVKAQAIGIGESVEASSVFAIAIGQGATNGDNTVASGFGSIAIGNKAKALNDEKQFFDLTRNVAIGSESFTNARNAVALGYQSNATGESSAALGSKANSTGVRSIAIGDGASATHDESIALGYSSKTESPVTTSQITINGLRYIFAGTSRSVVSVGNTGGEDGSNAVKRQIVNVAAGRISDSSTDAVNGSQLYAAIGTVGNLANSLKTELGGNASLDNNGTITMSNIGGTGQDTIHDAIAFVNAKQGGGTPVNVAQGDGIVVTNSTANGEKTFTVGLAPAVRADIDKAKTDAAKGIADAAAAQNTANTATTKADAAQATANTANTTAQTANTTANRVAATTYTFSIANSQAAGTSNTGIADTWRTTTTDSLTLGATSDLSVTTDGQGKVIYGLSDQTKASITKAQTDATKALADAKAVDDKATAAQTAVNALKPQVDKNTADIATLKDTKADKSYVDAQNAVQDTAIQANTDAIKALDDKKADKADLEALKQNITTTIQPALDAKANKADVDAKNAQQDFEIQVNRDSILALKDMKADQSALDATNSKLDALDDAAVKYDDPAVKDKVTFAGADGTTLTNIKDGAVTADSKDAVNGSQLYAVKVVADTAKAQSDDNKAAIAVLDDKKADKTALEATDVKVKANADNIAKGFNVATADGTSANYQLGDTVSILGGNNIDTKTVDGTVSVALKDDITVKTITIDGSSVGLGADGINAGDKKIINVADGEVSATSKDAVNGSQLHAVKVVADTAKAQSDANTAEIERLDAQKADRSELAATDAKVQALNDIAVKYDSTAKDTITLGGADGTTITNVKAGTISANSTDAVNGSQLFDVYNYVNQGNDAMRQHINTVEDKLQAGIAGANASAALPQVRGHGKSMMAFGMGGFQDKGAIAVGYSRASDNGRTVFKAHFNADTEKQFGGGVGLGFEW